MRTRRGGRTGQLLRPHCGRLARRGEDRRGIERHRAGARPRWLGQLAVAVVVACGGGDTPTGPPPPPPPPPPPDGRIGPEGGTFVAAGGDVTLVFPPGALSEKTAISVSAASAFPENPRIVAGTVYRYEPEGLQFARPVELTVKYEVAALPEGVRAAELRLHRVAGGTWQEVTASGPEEGDLVTGAITGFSVYGLLGVPVASLDIGPDSTGVVLRGTVQLAAVASDATGLPLPDRPIAWSSSSDAVATVDQGGLVTGIAVGKATITATAEGLRASALVSVEQVATQLLVQTQPDDAASGAAFGKQPVIALGDVNGDIVTADNSTVVTASLTSGGGTLEGTTSVEASGGLATFADLAISGAVGPYALAFEAADLPVVTSTSFVLRPGAVSPAMSVVSASSDEIGSGEVAQLQLRARDAQGNPQDQGGLVVAFTISGGTSRGTIGATVDNDDGTYSAGFLGTTPGSPTTIGATIGGAPVTSDLPTILVLGGAIAGTIGTSFAGGSASADLVELFDNGGSRITTVVPDPAGSYIIPDLAAGAYTLRLHPGLGFALGPDEADPRSVDVIGRDTVQVDFIVEPAIWFDDFSGYVDEADFEANAFREAGGRRVTPSGLIAPCVPDWISLDAEGMRLSWWDRVADPTGDSSGAPGCADADPASSISIGYGREWTSPRPTSRQWWVRLVSKEGTVQDGFSINCAGAGGTFECNPEGNGVYKFALDDWESAVGVMGIQLAGAMTERVLNFVEIGCDRIEYPGHGEFHTYVYGVDLDADRAQVYVDGALVCDRNYAAEPGSPLNLRPGWNMNAGPAQAQSRWIREFGLYGGRPSVLPR